MSGRRKEEEQKKEEERGLVGELRDLSQAILDKIHPKVAAGEWAALFIIGQGETSCVDIRTQKGRIGGKHVVIYAPTVRNDKGRPVDLYVSLDRNVERAFLMSHGGLSRIIRNTLSFSTNEPSREQLLEYLELMRPLHEGLMERDRLINFGTQN